MTETDHDLSRLDQLTGQADDLWLITAVIQPFKLDDVTLALEANSPHIGLTVTDCRGFGRNRARERSTNTDVGDYKSKLRLEAAVAGRIRALAVARLIARLAHTGRPGDGKVLLTRLAGAVAIRDFSLDAAAL